MKAGGIASRPSTKMGGFVVGVALGKGSPFFISALWDVFMALY